MLCRAFCVSSDFDANAYLPQALPLKMSVTQKRKYGES